jgi:hypothetical protein
MLYEVQYIFEGLIGLNDKADSRFSGTLDNCKIFLKEEVSRLHESGFSSLLYDDGLTLEVLNQSNLEPTGDKYLIHHLF